MEVVLLVNIKTLFIITKYIYFLKVVKKLQYSSLCMNNKHFLEFFLESKGLALKYCMRGAGFELNRSHRFKTEEFSVVSSSE